MLCTPHGKYFEYFNISVSDKQSVMHSTLYKFSLLFSFLECDRVSSSTTRFSCCMPFVRESLKCTWDLSFLRESFYTIIIIYLFSKWNSLIVVAQGRKHFLELQNFMYSLCMHFLIYYFFTLIGLNSKGVICTTLYLKGLPRVRDIMVHEDKSSVNPILVDQINLILVSLGLPN